MIKIYTDGSCLDNPGNGGWAAIIIDDGKKTQIKGSKKNTTNNQMELLAPIQALKKIPKGSEVQIFTDSKYVKSGITEWIHNWKKNGWKTSNKQPVKNKELWTELDILSSEFEIDWNWVKAHSIDKLNNEVDLIAKEAANI
jgi:Ribonuclease HI